MRFLFKAQTVFIFGAVIKHPDITKKITTPKNLPSKDENPKQKRAHQAPFQISIFPALPY